MAVAAPAEEAVYENEPLGEDEGADTEEEASSFKIYACPRKPTPIQEAAHGDACHIPYRSCAPSVWGTREGGAVPKEEAIW